MNKNGDVTVDGEYKTPFKDPRKRFGASLGNLSSGRVGIINMANMNLHLACIIAIRYSAVRRQFGADTGEEIPVIEYQMQQVRLFPYLAASYLHHHFSRVFADDFFNFLMAGVSKEDPELLASMGQEIHGISSAAKPIAGWTAQDAIQECREACGGHGYLKKARFGTLRYVLTLVHRNCFRVIFIVWFAEMTMMLIAHTRGTTTFYCNRLLIGC